MERGELVGKLRARYGDRVQVARGIVSINTNGDDVEVFYREDSQKLNIDGTIVELGSGQHISIEVDTIDQVFRVIDNLSAIEGPMPSVGDAMAIAMQGVLLGSQIEPVPTVQPVIVMPESAA